MSHFEVTRSAAIEAGPERVHALIDDFHEWVAWSPWEDLDPDLRRTYTGPASGVGAHYAWSGNKKAGAGSMEITRSSPTEIGVHLTFLKPWKATSEITFLLTPSGAGTDLTWRMAGENKGMAAVVTKLFSMDKMVGRDFEKGLGRLKVAAEA
jgi:hypothetical protein